MSSSPRLALAEKACSFLTSSTDPFYAVANCVKKLEAAGFQAFRKNHAVAPGGKYYYTVHHSTLVAFTVGEKASLGKSGFHVIGGHTDSPNLKIKPRSKRPPKNGYLQLGCECYGGGLWHTWFDRDLSLSGKVLVRDGDKIKTKFVQLEDPVARVSTLCIHLQSADERAAFSVNKEEHTSPIIAMAPNKELEEDIAKQINGDSWKHGHEPLLLVRIAKELGIQVDQIADFELNMYDTQPATIGGMNKEFLYSARLDNLATVFCSVEALVNHSSDLSNDQDVAMVVCFDHEEVGSASSHGAGSPVMEEAVKLVSAALNGGEAVKPDTYSDMIANSFVLSIDQAHAIHPNYASKHEAQHSPLMNAGVVIKTNSNQRYTTNSLTGFIVRELAKKVNTPIQEFVVRNDCPCGSTIGPIISTRTGIRTVDAGMPQLSMHSCREVMGVEDLTHGVELFQSFFKHFREVDESIEY